MAAHNTVDTIVEVIDKSQRGKLSKGPMREFWLERHFDTADHEFFWKENFKISPSGSITEILESSGTY